MRFCPFCSAENADEQAVCTACGRRLPPLPPRRRAAPATGINVPPRPPQRRSGTSNPPPIASPQARAPSPTAGAPDVTVPDAQAFQSGPTVVSAPPSPGDASGRSLTIESGALPALRAATTEQGGSPTTTTAAGFAPAPSPSTASGGFAPAPSPSTASGAFAAPSSPPPSGPGAGRGPAPTPASPSPSGPSARPASPPASANASGAFRPPSIASGANASGAFRPSSTASGALPRAGATTNPPPLPRAGSTTNPPPLAVRPPAPADASGPRVAPPPAPADASGVTAEGPDRNDPTIRVTEPPRHSASQVAPLPVPQRGVLASPGARQARAGSHAELGPPPPRESAPSLPPPPDDAAKRSLLSAITPGPAAQRREAAPSDRDPAGRARRVSDGWGDLEQGAQAPRPKTTSSPPPIPPARPSSQQGNVVPPSAFGDDFHTTEAQAFEIESAKERDGDAPPPTRIHNPELHADRPFQPPKVSTVPEKPEPGLYHAARYALRFARARYQRRGAIKTLKAEIKQDTEALDQVLGALGKTARQQRVGGKVFAAENKAINDAEERIGVLSKEHADVDGRKAEENSKFVDVEREKTTKLSEAERLVDETSRELANLEGQRRALRDKRKELERRQKAYLKAAEDNDKQSGSAQMGDTRAELRRGAEQMRKEAAALEPDRQEVDRRLAALERPIGEATAKLDAAKAELDAAKRSLSDAREGHTHRLAELDAEQKRKSREIAQAEGEIARRLVTLGTLVNLNRIEQPAFAELYQRIDRLRGAITARTTEIEKLTSEREAYDRGAMVRGLSAIFGAAVALIALIVILRAIF